jgi:hypothetical protein
MGKVTREFIFCILILCWFGENEKNIELMDNSIIVRKEYYL